MRCGGPPSDLDAKMYSTQSHKDAHIRTDSTQTVSGLKDTESSESKVDWGSENSETEGRWFDSHGQLGYRLIQVSIQQMTIMDSLIKEK